MKFALQTGDTNVKYATLSGEDFLSALKYQMRNVARTTTGELAVFNPNNSNAITGILTKGENPEWETSDLDSYTLASATETKDISFAEFKNMLEKRFKADHPELTSNYSGVTAKVVNGELVVTFPQNFLKWNAIHEYNGNNYNITAHVDKAALANKLDTTGTNVTGNGIQSFKITLQGKQSGTTEDAIDVVLTAIQ